MQERHPSPLLNNPHTAPPETRAPVSVTPTEGPLHRGSIKETIRIEWENVAVQKELREQLAAAKIDPLTGFPNRSALEDDIARYTEHSEYTGQEYLVVVLDVNNLKIANDKSEDKHTIGDKYLRGISDAIRENIYPGDAAYRVGGDEFIVLIPVDEHTPEVEVFQSKYSNRINKTVVELVDPDVDKVLRSNGYKPYVAAGVAKWDSRAERFGDVLISADRIMYDKKEESKAS